jgi:hypothetical protein
MLIADMTATDFRVGIHKQGYDPIPLEGKRPGLRGWQKRNNQSPESIQRWAGEYPNLLSTGILTATTPALDVDILDPEIADAAEQFVRQWVFDGGYKDPLLRRVGQWPKRAFLFKTESPFAKIRVPLVMRDGRRGDKIEFLCDGQQIVVHGTHPTTGKPYEWDQYGSPLDKARSQLPPITAGDANSLVSELVAYLATLGVTVAGTSPSILGLEDTPRRRGEDLLERIRRGEDLHDNGIAWLARVARFGLLSAEHAIDTVVAAAEESGREPERLAEYRAEMERAAAGAWQKFSERSFDDLAFLNERRAYTNGQDHATGESQEPPQPKSAPDPDPPRSKYLLVSYGKEIQMEHIAWCVEKLIPQTGVGLISGQWGVYKTFTAIDLAKSIIRGQPFVRYPVSRPGGVLFFAYENFEGIHLRIKGALEQSYDRVEDTPRYLPFTWVDSGPKFLADPVVTVRELTEIIEETKRKFQEQFNVPLVLVIIDTALAAAGYKERGDENDAVLGQKIKRILETIAKEHNIFIFVVDHRGKNPATGTRGSSAKDAWADTILGLIGENVEGVINNPRLAVVKVKGAPQGAQYPIKPRVVEVNCGNERTETTLVLDWGRDQDAILASPDEKKWSTKPLKLLRRVLLSADAEHGREIEPTPSEKVRACPIDAMRDQFYTLYPTGESDPKKAKDARRKALARAIGDGQAKNLIGFVTIDGHEFAWILKPTPPTKG